MVRYRTAEANGLQIFYREAGNPDSTAILLLHGFPTSSHMFRNLIPLLAEQYHVIAPDFPGFGFSDAPDHTLYKYTFDQIAKTMEAFIEAIHLKKYILYVFDYGSPVGFRLALTNPEKVLGIVSQNGNAYEEGLSSGWDPIRKYWGNPNQENRDALRKFLKLEGIKWQYTYGVKDQSLIAPETYTLDAASLARPGNDEIQLDLFLDYANNVKLYPKFQEYLRTKKPPLLAVWGKNDPFFLPEGAEAYKRDNPQAEVHFYDTGHFALETHFKEIGSAMKDFIKLRLGKSLMRTGT